MDRLLGAKDRNRAPEPEPSVRSTSTSVRGTQHEEFSEAEPLDAKSVVAPALAEEGLKRSSMIAALPSGGPDADAKTSSKLVKTGRAPLAITKVSGDSYKGAGRVDRNIKRAEKRKGIKAAQRERKARLARAARRKALLAKSAKGKSAKGKSAPGKSAQGKSVKSAKPSKK